MDELERAEHGELVVGPVGVEHPEVVEADVGADPLKTLLLPVPGQDAGHVGAVAADRALVGLVVVDTEQRVEELPVDLASGLEPVRQLLELDAQAASGGVEATSPSFLPGGVDGVLPVEQDPDSGELVVEPWVVERLGEDVLRLQQLAHDLLVEEGANAGEVVGSLHP